MSNPHEFRLGCVCAPTTHVSPYALSTHPQTGDVVTSFGTVLALCSAHTRRQDRFLSIRAGRVADVPARPVCCSFSPCGCHLAAAFDKPWHFEGQEAKIFVFAVDQRPGESAIIRPLPSGPRGVCRQVAWSSDGEFLAAAGTDPCVTLWTWPSRVCFAQLTAAVPALALSWGHRGAPLGLMVASPGALVWCQVHLPAQGLDATLTELPGATLEPRVLDLSEIAKVHNAQELTDLSSAEDGTVFVITRQGWLLRIWRERLDKFATVHTEAVVSVEDYAKPPCAVECARGGQVACALGNRTVRLFDGNSLNALADLRCDLPGSVDTIGLACGGVLWALYADGCIAGFSNDPCDNDSPTMLHMGRQHESLSADTGLIALPLAGHESHFINHASRRGGTSVNDEDYFAVCGGHGLRFCSSSGTLASVAHEEEDGNPKVSAVAVCGSRQVLLACGHPGGLLTGFALQPAVSSAVEHFQNMPRFSINLRSEAEVLAIGLQILAVPPEMSGAFDACCLVAAACADATIEIHRLPFLSAGMQIVFGEPCSLASMSESFQGGPLPALCLFDGGAVVDEAGIFGGSDFLGVEESVVEQPARRCAFLVTGGPQRLLVREITICEGCPAGMRRVHQEDARDGSWIGFSSMTDGSLALDSTVLAADNNGRLVEFTVATGKCCHQTHVALSEGSQLSGPLSINNNRHLLAVCTTRQGTRQPNVLVVDVKNGDRIADLNCCASPVQSLAFCKSNDHLAAAAVDGSLFVWYPDKGDVHTQLRMTGSGFSTVGKCGDRAERHASNYQASAISALPSLSPNEGHRPPPLPKSEHHMTPLHKDNSNVDGEIADPGKGSIAASRVLPGEISASTVWNALSSPVWDDSGTSTIEDQKVTAGKTQGKAPVAQELSRETCGVRLALENLLDQVEAAGGLHDNSIDCAAVVELDKLLAVAEQRLRPLLYPPHAKLAAAQKKLHVEDH